MDSADNTVSTAPAVQKKRKAGGRPFPKGKSGNPSGRPKGRPNYAKELDRALRRLRTVKKIDWFEELITRSLTSERLTIEILPYLISRLGIAPEQAAPAAVRITQNIVNLKGLSDMPEAQIGDAYSQLDRIIAASKQIEIEDQSND